MTLLITSSQSMWIVDKGFAKNKILNDHMTKSLYWWPLYNQCELCEKGFSKNAILNEQIKSTMTLLMTLYKQCESDKWFAKKAILNENMNNYHDFTDKLFIINVNHVAQVLLNMQYWMSTWPNTMTYRWPLLLPFLVHKETKVENKSFLAFKNL